MNEKKTAETKADKVWEGLSQLDDKYFLEEYHPSYFKVKEGMDEDHNRLRDAMEFITDTEEETAALREQNERLKEALKVYKENLKRAIHTIFNNQHSVTRIQIIELIDEI